MVLLCSGRIATDPDPDRATVVVHVPAETLLAHDATSAPNAEAEGDPVLAPVTARRLSCDARLQFSLDDAHGIPLMLGRRTRVPRPPWSGRSGAGTAPADSQGAGARGTPTRTMSGGGPTAGGPTWRT